MADVKGAVISFLRGKGLNNYAIAAVLGNMQIESGFSTGALNGKEHAIGLIQWEGGRRANLQHFAAARGTSETDLNTQLNFMWHELTTDYTGSLNALRSATSAAAAAADFDQHYEVSSGSSRSERVASANSFFSSGLKGGTVPVGVRDHTITTDSTSSTGDAGLTAADYKNALGPLAGLLSSVPDLKSILDNALATDQSSADFLNDIQNSNWYRTHGDSVRQGLALKASDPATYAANMAKANTHVHQLATSLGVSLVGDEANRLAHQYVLGAWDDQTLQQHIGSYFKANNGGSGGSIYGQAAALQTQLKQTAADYGTGITGVALANWTQQIIMGGNTMDGYKKFVIDGAKAKYPGLIHQIDSGLTVNQIADPYRQSMAQLLEIDPNTIDVNDPQLKKALQGTSTVTEGTASKPVTAAMPVWQFEQQLRTDPRWQYTKNATDSASSTLVKLGQDWGFGI